MDKTDIYINLHPDYCYATAMLHNFVDVREWVRLIDWLSWGVNKRELQITGGLANEVGSHIKKGYVMAFCQLMDSLGATMKIRNNRSDEWSDVEIVERLDNEKYIKVLCDKWHVDDTAEWLKEKVAKNTALAEEANRQGLEEAETISKKEIDFSLERLNKMREEEAKRQKRICHLAIGGLKHDRKTEMESRLPIL